MAEIFMKKLYCFSLILLFKPACAAVLYHNSFDSLSSLNEFSTTGSAHIENGALVFPHFGGGSTVLDLNVINGYSPTLSANPQTVSIGFNVEIDNWASQGNPGFEFYLSSSTDSPLNLGTVGYSIRAGSLVDNRTIFGYSNSTQNLTYILVDIPNGLPDSPSLGSMRLDYDPSDSSWKFYLKIGNEFFDPESLSDRDLMGTAIDEHFTEVPLSYLGLRRNLAGTIRMDNLTIRSVPESTSAVLFLFSSTFLFVRRRNKDSEQDVAHQPA